MNKSKIDRRLIAFRSKRKRHQRLQQALNHLLRVVENARPESVVIFTGPSGVGKSTIVEHLEKHLGHLYAEEMAKDPGFLPYLSLKAPPPLDGHFNWKDLFTRLLIDAGETLIESKFLSHFEFDLDGQTLVTTMGRVREELRRALESLVRNRRVKVLILDEASSLLRLKKGSAPLLQFEILKSLAVELRIPIVLVGAYDLLGILDGTGALLRRSDVVHFPRYVLSSEPKDREDMDNFRDVLSSFLEAIEIPKEDGLLEHCEYFMIKSVGCVGVLKDWLDRALAAALSESPSQPVLTRKLIEANALPNNELMKLTQEAIDGERRMEQVKDSELASLIGLDHIPTLCDSTTENSKGKSLTRKRPAGPVAHRGPSRDPVGGAHV